MFEQLQNKFARIFKNIKGHGKISENNISEAIREIRIALLESDVNYKVVQTFIDKVKNSAFGAKVYDSITPGQQFIKIVLDELVEFLNSKNLEINLNNQNTTIIVMAGLQGSGKTTTAAKLACFLKREKKLNPLLIGIDLQRPAAMEQLNVLANSNKIDCYVELKSKDPIKVLKNGIIKSKELASDIIIIDTAGRLHVDKKLIAELKEIIHISKPDEVFYIADGMTGQDAVNSSKVFSDECKLTGCIVTKMDGDSRGGAALSIREVTQKPIKFLGIGESIDAIEVFHPNRLAQRILEMGDVVSLVEKAQDVFDEKSAMQMQRKMLGNTFSLADFKDQLKQIKKMGSISHMMGMIPGASKLKGMEMDDQQLIWIEAIINSMTPTERERPELINGSRRKRIAKGAGRSVQEVNQLLKQFSQMRTMMKKFGKMGKGTFPIGL